MRPALALPQACGERGQAWYIALTLQYTKPDPVHFLFGAPLVHGEREPVDMSAAIAEKRPANRYVPHS